MLDLTAEGNSQRDQQASIAFTALLQAALSTSSACTNVEWVERAELRKVTDELTVAAMGVASLNDNLRTGQWLGADLLVLGRFDRSLTNQLTLVLDAIDAHCADRLETIRAPLPLANQARIRETFAHSATILRAAEQLVAVAAARWQAEQLPRRAALLTFEPSAPSLLASQFNQRFRTALSSALNREGWRLITFSRAGDAGDESTLGLAGLTQANPQSWTNLAQAYLWGQFTLLSEDARTPIFGRPALPPSQARLVLELFPRAGSLLTVTQTVTLSEELETNMTALVSALRGLNRLDQQPASTDDVWRRRLAATLLEQAERVRVAPWSSVGTGWFQPEARERLRRLQQLHEAACFFAPDSESAAYAALDLRWGRDYASHVTNQFWFQWLGAEAWGQYVERFGLTNPLVIPRFLSGPGEIVETLTSGGRFRRGVPDDLEHGQADEWIRRWTAELRRRESLVASIRNPPPAPIPEPPRAPGPTRLPRASAVLFSAERPLQFFDLPLLEFPPETISATVDPIPFPPTMDVQSIVDLDWGGDRLWVVAEGTEAVRAPPTASPQPGGLAPDATRGTTLWRFNPATKLLERIGSPQDNQVNGVEWSGGAAWVGADRTRLGSAFATTTTLNYLPTAELPRELSVHALGGNSTTVFALGLRDEIHGYEPKANRWTLLRPPIANVFSTLHVAHCAASDQWVLAAGRDVSLLHLPSHTTTPVDALVFEDALEARPKVHCLRAAADGSFWMGSSAGLHQVLAAERKARNWQALPPALSTVPLLPLAGVDPRRQTDLQDQRLATTLDAVARRRRDFHARRSTHPGGPNVIEPISRLPGQVTAVCPDGDHVWIGCKSPTGSNAVVTYHWPTERWLGQVRVPGVVLCLAVSESTLWVGLAGPEGFRLGKWPPALFQISKAGLLAQARPVADTVERNWIDAKVAAWSPRQRAIFAFFRGDYAGAAAQLGPLDLATADFESLFVLGLCHDELGLKKPDISQRCLDAIAQRDQRGIIARVIRDLPAGKPALRSRTPISIP